MAGKSVKTWGFFLKAQERQRSKRAHRDRGVGEGVLWGRADDWWDSPSRAGTRTATSRKLTHTKKRPKKKKKKKKDS